jgi:phosphoribosylformylglycinamidine synthase
MIYVLKNILNMPVVNLWHKDHDLQGCDFIILPGGFSYGDYLRSGAIARFSPIMQEVIQFANKGGYVMGICNGFQILTESHLLPGALLHNNNQKFICKNVHIRVETTQSLITSQAQKGQVLQIPIAHGEGRFYADSDTIKSIEDNDQVLFRYCTPDGQITEASNPNGAVNNIAGICNKQRNVFGMMPHPERCSDKHLHNTDGRILFESAISAVLS